MKTYATILFFLHKKFPVNIVKIRYRPILPFVALALRKTFRIKDKEINKMRP